MRKRLLNNLTSGIAAVGLFVAACSSSAPPSPTMQAAPATAGLLPKPAPTVAATVSSTVAECRVQVSINGGPSQYKDQPASFCGLP